MPSCCRRSLVVGTQINPRPCLAMKLIAVGVTCCAAMMRSPSFSRSASSTTMTILPLRISAMTDSMLSNFFIALLLKCFHRRLIYLLDRDLFLLRQLLARFKLRCNLHNFSVQLAEFHSHAAKLGFHRGELASQLAPFRNRPPDAERRRLAQNHFTELVCVRFRAK